MVKAVYEVDDFPDDDALWRIEMDRRFPHGIVLRDEPVGDTP